METVLTKTRKPKASDKDLKEYFQNYSESRERIKEIKKHLISRPLTQNELNEIKYLEEGMELDEDILACFPERERYVLEQFYLEHIHLFPISMDICYGYEYTSVLKVEASDRLKRLISGNAIRSELGLNLIGQVKEFLATR